jgi:hypothetical protein
MGRQPLQGHLSGPGSVCNYPTLLNKRIRQLPKADKFEQAHGKFIQAHFTDNNRTLVDVGFYALAA